MLECLCVCARVRTRDRIVFPNAQHDTHTQWYLLAQACIPCILTQRSRIKYVHHIHIFLRAAFAYLRLSVCVCEHVCVLCAGDKTDGASGATLLICYLCNTIWAKTCPESRAHTHTREPPYISISVIDGRSGFCPMSMHM